MEAHDYAAARPFLERAVQLAPDEPAAWADLGLQALRTGALEDAFHDLERAQRFAPKSARVERIYALVAERTGHDQEAVWRLQGTVGLDPGDLIAKRKLAFAYERVGILRGAMNSMADVCGAAPANTYALVQLARLAAKSGDASTARRAAMEIRGRSSSWPTAAKRELAAIQRIVNMRDVRAAAARAAALDAALSSVQEYREDRRVLTLPDDPGDLPIDGFLLLPNRTCRIAPPDTGMIFSARPLVPSGKAIWCGAAWLNGDGNPVPAMLASGELHVGRDVGAVPGFSGGVFPHAVVEGILDESRRLTVAVAGRAGIRLFRIDAAGRLREATSGSGLPASILSLPCSGIWAADIFSHGALDLVVAPVRGAPVVLRNAGNGRFTATRPFAGVHNVRDCLCADLRGEGLQDAAFVDAAGALHLFRNLGNGRFRELPASVQANLAALSIGDVGPDGALDPIALCCDGTIIRLVNRGDGLDSGVVARPSAQPAGRIVPGEACLLTADLDNNGGTDIVASTAAGTQIWLRDTGGAYQPLAPIRERVLAVADVSGRGRLDLIGLTGAGAPVLLANSGGKSYHWLSLRPRAGKKIGANPLCMGGEIRARAGFVAQRQPILGPQVHFGLGESSEIGVARILCPDGRATIRAGYNLKPDSERTILLRAPN